ncbi:MAG: cytochrome c peroxidase [Anaeromyxobacteraceae bacterium]
MTPTISKLSGLAALATVATLAACAPQPAPQPAQAELGTARQAIVTGISCQAPGTGFGDVLVAGPPGTLPFIPLEPLAVAGNPVFPPALFTGKPQLRADLAAFYIADVTAAIQLGKALFWDTQAGSDNRTACATCHFHAGADRRSRHQLNPGFNAVFDGAATNWQLTQGDYPFVVGRAGALTRNVDNATGSAGVRATKLKSVTGAVEQTTASTAPVFGTMRQVTAVNTPSSINAVFNHRVFHNGRAQPEFNGVNPWGARDATAKVNLADAAGNLTLTTIRIDNASLASQAVGPPVNPVEMSAAGRTFQDLAVKMLASKPLAGQFVSPSDSVLGPLAAPGGLGLNTTYAALIQKAFLPMWWNSAKLAKVGTKSYTLMQANFSLYWGLSIMLYEATLVSDASPMDRYAASRLDPVTKLPKTTACTDLTGRPSICIAPGDPTLLQPVVDRLSREGLTIPLADGTTRPVTVDDILTGLDLFEQPVPPPGIVGLPARTGTTPGAGAGCALCHVGAETTSASVRNLTIGIEAGAENFKGAGFDLRMERMFTGVRTPPPAPVLPGFFPSPPQPPPPVPYGSDVITYDNVSYAVNVTDINNAPVAPQLVPVKTYDVGWYNIGVRPTAEDLGLGGLDFASKPLSWTEYFQKTMLNPTTVLVPGGGIGCVDVNGAPVVPPSAPFGSPFAGQVLDPANGFPLLSGGLSKTEATDVAGSFKTPALRNVELTGPYFHMGGAATLMQVVEFYDDGGHFANAALSPLIRPLGLTEAQRVALVAFLLSLTDERVVNEQAPFDHPELAVPEGQTAAGADITGTTLVGAVGATGAAPLPRFLRLNPSQP